MTPTLLVYLAEPIDAAGAPSHYIDRAQHHLTRHGWACYRPAAAWANGHTTPTQVNNTNNAVLNCADLVVADLSGCTPTIGVPLEIMRANNRGTPVIVLRAEDQRSAILDGMPGITTVRVPFTGDTIIDWATKLVNQSLGEYGRGPNLLKLKLAPGYENRADTRTYPDDAGIDLIATGTTEIRLGEYADIPTHVVGIQLPADTWGFITGRSSTLRKLGLHVITGVIDPGWRGPLFVGVHNTRGLGTNSEAIQGAAPGPVLVTPGVRLGQLIPLRNRTADLTIVAVDQLDPHPRGLNGFGSSGA